MELKLDSPTLEALVQKGVLDALGEAGKVAVATEVAKYLTNKNHRDPFDRREMSPLQSALERAGRAAAEKILSEKLLADTEFSKEVERLYEDAAKHMFGAENRQKMVERLADAMSKAIAEDRYR